jgi:hypothetical protein
MDLPKRPLNHLSHKAAHRPARRSNTPMIHDITPVHWTPRRASVNPPVSQPQAATLSTPPRVSGQRRIRKHGASPWAQWLKKYGLVVAALLAVIVIVRLSAAPGTGGLVVAAYAIGVLMLRIPSRVTFLLAALALAGIGIELLLLPAPGRANNGALLVFLLLGVALVSSVLETRRLESKNRLSRRR